MTNPTERPEERDSLAAMAAGYQDSAEHDLEVSDEMSGGPRIRALEAEVKELREKLDAATAPYPEAFEAGRQAAARIKQMEEALRRIRDLRPNSGSSLDACIDIARAALSPSDTEERRS